jgi:tetratricopeptide (TPR) repeat protein
MHGDLRAGRHRECAAALAWLLRHDRLISEDWMIRARIEQLDGRFDAAIESLNRVDDRDPLASQARLMNGLIELERDRARASEAAFRKSLELDPGQTSARYELLRLYSRQQRLAELDLLFDALTERNVLDFDYVRFWFMTRHAPWEAKDDIAMLKRMVTADPLDRWSRLALAEALRLVGRREETLEVLNPLPEADLEARAIRASLAIHEGDLDRAEQLLAFGPIDHPRLAELRGQLALGRADGPAAVRNFRRAYAAQPDDRVIITGLATALKLVGDTAAASELLTKIRRFDELTPLVARITAADAANDGELHRKLGSVCEAIGRHALARAWYRLAITRNPLDTESQRALYRLKTAAATPTAG